MLHYRQTSKVLSLRLGLLQLLGCSFGIGPGAVIGNDIFGSPNDISTWTFGIPSIWAWHILFWILGVGMMWFLAYKMEMSTLPRKSVSALVDDIGDSAKSINYKYILKYSRRAGILALLFF